MKLSFASAVLATAVTQIAATPILSTSLQQRHDSPLAPLDRRDTYCENSASNRTCWGYYSINDDWYVTTPDTGVTREYWLEAQNTTLAPDGYERITLNFNGTIPGPTITADWGDTVIVHVTNKLENNGTTVHMHGVRQQDNTQFDGVPGAVQCPIAPGETFTYTFRATQYGTTWYHSHHSLQYSEGLYGPIVINGPASANYDEDLGVLALSDWFHDTAFSLWDYAQTGTPPTPDNGLINGTNTFDCSTVDDSACVGTGTRSELVFESGKTYRIRLVNVATEGFFRFAIDDHTFQVIAMDLIPIVPYSTDSVVIANGQRYDIVVTANQTSDNYWMRAIYDSDCTSIDVSLDDIKGIIRYDSSSTDDPTTTGTTFTAQCYDEDSSNLVPYVAQSVGSADSTYNTDLNYTYPDDIWMWTFNSSSLIVNWSEPSIVSLYNAGSVADLVLPTDANAWELNDANQWVYFAIHDESDTDLGHPIHLHGHDFFVLASGSGTYDPDTTVLNLDNPPRRDTATLPGDGYLVIAFITDNPGAWVLHCHIAWHASEGMGIQFLERGDEIVDTLTSYSSITEGCSAWNSYAAENIFQDDAGI